MFNKELISILSQVKFRPNILSFNDVAKVANKYEPKFEEWTAPKNEQIDLYSLSKKEALQLHYNAITYISENFDTEEKGVKYVTSAYKEYYELFEIKEVRWVGLRSICLFSTSFNLQDLTDLIFSKFYTSNQKIKDISSDKIRDVVYVLDGIKEGIKNHVQIGPVLGKDISKFFTTRFGPINEEFNNDKAYIFFDCDTFIDTSINDPTAINDTFNQLLKQNTSFRDQYLDYLSE